MTRLSPRVDAACADAAQAKAEHVSMRRLWADIDPSNYLSAEAKDFQVRIIPLRVMSPCASMILTPDDVMFTPDHSSHRMFTGCNQLGAVRARGAHRTREGERPTSRARGERIEGGRGGGGWGFRGRDRSCE